MSFQKLTKSQEKKVRKVYETEDWSKRQALLDEFKLGLSGATFEFEGKLLTLVTINHETKGRYSFLRPKPEGRKAGT